MQRAALRAGRRCRNFGNRQTCGPEGCRNNSVCVERIVDFFFWDVEQELPWVHSTVAESNTCSDRVARGTPRQSCPARFRIWAILIEFLRQVSASSQIE